MSEGSFPHPSPEPGHELDADEVVAGEVVAGGVVEGDVVEDDLATVGARVLDFPTEEVSSPGVPAGTWADEDAEALEQGDRLLRPAGGQVVEFPRPGTHKRRRAPRESSPRLRDASGRQPRVDPHAIESVEPETPPRPAFLASALLQQDWWPAQPHAQALRWSAVGVGVVGVVTVVAIGGAGASSLGLGGLLALCAIAGIVPIRPELRAAALAVVGLAGGFWASMAGVEQGEGATPLLTACVALASSALFFRAAHRLSRLARAMVGVGLGATVGWLVLSGGIDALIVEGLAWQAWVGPVSRAALGILVLTAALSFLDPKGDGGARVTAGALLAWLGVHTVGAILVTAVPDAEVGRELALSLPVLEAAALPFFVALASAGLCQLWVSLSRGLRARHA